MTFRRSAIAVSVAIGAALLAACTSGQVGQYPVTHVPVASNSKLQFGVGWLTSYPSTGIVPQYQYTSYGVNFVETFRQANGRSAVLSDTPEVDVPQLLAAQLVLQNPPNPGSTTPPNSLFFPASVQAYGAGLNAGPTVGLASDANLELNAVGGLPAFPAPVDGTTLNPLYWEGYYASFPVVPMNQSAALGPDLRNALAIFPGTYTLNVTVPTGGLNTQIVSASANLNSKPLPVIPPASVVPDGTGGALVSITVPAGVTESIVTIVAGACQDQSTQTGATPLPSTQLPQTYSLVSHLAGPGTDRLTLPDFVTPVAGGGQYRSLCSTAQTGAQNHYTAMVAGFDYPAFESVYPQNSSETPAIVGAAGEPDITISAPTSFLTP